MNAEDVAIVIFAILSALLVWFQPRWLQVIFT